MKKFKNLMRPETGVFATAPMSFSGMLPFHPQQYILSGLLLLVSTCQVPPNGQTDTVTLDTSLPTCSFARLTAGLFSNLLPVPTAVGKGILPVNECAPHPGFFVTWQEKIS